MPAVLGDVPVGAGEEDAPVGEVRVRVPDLLAVDDPLVAVALRPGCVSPARSEPAPGSLKSWHHTSSPRSSGGTYRLFCSSVPCTRIVGTTMPRPTANTPVSIAYLHRLLAPDALVRRRCRPRPPYSAGTVSPAKPAVEDLALPRLALLGVLELLLARLRGRGEPSLEVAGVEVARPSAFAASHFFASARNSASSGASCCSSGRDRGHYLLLLLDRVRGSSRRSTWRSTAPRRRRPDRARPWRPRPGARPPCPAPAARPRRSAASPTRRSGSTTARRPTG